MDLLKVKSYNGLKYFFSEVGDGNLSFHFNGQASDDETVAKNRKKFFKKIGIDLDNTVGIWVEGSDRVLVADPSLAGVGMTDKEHAVRCDALLTNKKNLFLFLLIADCLPVILYDPQNQAVGIVHVGWKGADLELPKKVIAKMVSEYGTDPEKLIVGFGPSARKESFIKKSPSQKNDPRWRKFLERVGSDEFKVDVAGFCREQLRDMGVLKENIFDCGINTVTDTRFFSHYRQNKLPHNLQGRFACVVGLV